MHGEPRGLGRQSRPISRFEVCRYTSLELQPFAHKLETELVELAPDVRSVDEEAKVMDSLILSIGFHHFGDPAERCTLD